MSSGIVLRTGMALTLVAVSPLSGCGDDDAPTVAVSDAGDAAANATNSTNSSERPSSETESSDETDDSSSSVTSSVPDATAVTSGPDAEVIPDASDVTGVGDAGVTDPTSSSDTTAVTTSDSDAATPSTDEDSGVEEGDAGDAEVSPPVGWVGLQIGEAEPQTVEVSTDGDEAFYGLVFDSDGNFYTVGTATDVSGEEPDVYLTVTKFAGNGAVDESFGTDGDGVARINVSVGGTEQARAIVIQNVAAESDAGADASASTPYIVIAGTKQVDPEADGVAAAEADAVVVRFNMSGEVDENFGTLGVATFNFNTGNEGSGSELEPVWLNNDSVWSLATTLGDRLVIHGSQRGEGDDELEDGGTTPRVDADFLLMRLLADGTPDDSFGEEGRVLLDLDGANASARAATVFEDGTVIGVGYLSSTILGEDTQQPVLYKVDPSGAFDPDFATEDAWAQPGVFHGRVVPAPLKAEAYGAAAQGENFVTLGYGPSNVGGGLTNDLIALRFTSDGVHDTSFGTDGATYLDYAGQSDNGRAVVVLPDHTVLAIGSGRTLLDEVNTQSDAVLALLTPDGVAIDAFGTNGMRGYDFGLTDAFWAAALSPDQNSVVVVGIKGGVETDAGVTDSDSVVLVLPLTAVTN